MDIDLEEYEAIEEKPPKRKPSNQSAKDKKKAVNPEELLRNATHHYRKAEYQNVIDLVTDFVEEYYSHLFALKMLAFSLIFAGHYAEARRYVQRVLSVNRNEAEALNALAYLELSEGNTNSAINHLLDAVYVNKDNDRLADNLEKIRSMKDPKVFVSLTPPEEFLFLTMPKPQLGELIREKIAALFANRMVRLGLGLVILIGVILILVAKWPSIKNMFEQARMARLGYDLNYHISIKDIEELMEEKEHYSLALTEDEVSYKYSLARDNIQNGNHNMALLLINQIINSDADELIKERTLILKDMVPDPVMDNIDYIPAYADVVVAPLLYEGIYVKWNGTVANIEHLDREETVFDLLINFVDDAIVDGIAEAHFEGFQHIMNGEKISLYGTILGITLDNAVIVEGDQIIRLE